MMLLVARTCSGLPRLGEWCLLLLLSALAAGCAGYQLGTGSEPEFETLHISPVRNQTLAPQVRAPLQSALAEAFLRDGTLRLAGKDEAGGVLEVIITDYQRQGVAALPADTGRDFGFLLTLTAQVRLTESARGEVILDRPFTVETPIYATSNLNEVEYQTLPLLLSDLAEKVKDAVAAPW